MAWMADPLGNAEIRALLERASTIAVVGASTDPTKASNRIPAVLIDAGSPSSRCIPA